MPDDGVRLFVYGISASCPRDLLEDKFGKCGRVNDVYNTGKGFAFVTMVSILLQYSKKSRENQ